MISGKWFERTLVIAPHCDDETIGCGGLIGRLRIRDRFVHCCAVTGSEVRLGEFAEACQTLGCPSYSRLLPDMENSLDQVPDRELVGAFDALLTMYCPTAVLLPYASHHQDHQKVYKAVLAALRPHPTSTVLFAAMYEYPYVDAWHHHSIKGGKLTVDISRSITLKLGAMLCHKSQLPYDSRHLIHPSNLRRWASVRGAEIGVDFGECYYPLRMVLD